MGHFRREMTPSRRTIIEILEIKSLQEITTQLRKELVDLKMRLMVLPKLKQKKGGEGNTQKKQE